MVNSDRPKRYDAGSYSKGLRDAARVVIDLANRSDPEKRVYGLSEVTAVKPNQLASDWAEIKKLLASQNQTIESLTLAKQESEKKLQDALAELAKRPAAVAVTAEDEAAASEISHLVALNRSNASPVPKPLPIPSQPASGETTTFHIRT